MKIRKGSIVNIRVTHIFKEIVIVKILKYRIIGVYKNMICDFLRKNIIKVISY
jgi:hypothetical protein